MAQSLVSAEQNPVYSVALYQLHGVLAHTRTKTLVAFTLVLI